MLDCYRKVVVTGGLGFIGAHLVQSLLSSRVDVTVLDNLDTTALRSEPPAGVPVVSVDIRDLDRLEGVLGGTDLVFHLAGNSSGTRSVTAPRFDFETNAVGTFNVVSAAVSAGVRRVVYVSSASVYGTPQRFPIDEDHPTRPFVPYGASKLAAEVTALALSKALGIEVVAGRPFCVYGPGENPHVALVEIARYLRWHLNGQPVQVVGDPDTKTRDFVHVIDVVAALVIIAERASSGEVFNIGSGHEASMRHVVTAIGRATGRAATIEALTDITEVTFRLVADISKLKGLGYRPRVALDDGIARLAAELGESPQLPDTPTVFTAGQRGEH